MSELGSIELIFILLLALLVIGPEKTRELISLIGKAVRTFKSAIISLKENVDYNEDIKEIKNEIDDLKGSLDVSEELSGNKSNLKHIKNNGGEEK